MEDPPKRGRSRHCTARSDGFVRLRRHLAGDADFLDDGETLQNHEDCFRAAFDDYDTSFGHGLGTEQPAMRHADERT